MRCSLVTITAALLMVGCREQAKPTLYELNFGLTATLHDDGRPAPDFISSYGTAVPRVIRECRAEFLGFNPHTDGGEGAFFEAKGEPGTATA
jgi:hypothetical protein